MSRMTTVIGGLMVVAGLAATDAGAATSLQSTSAARVRTGPGSGYAAIGTVPAGHGIVGIAKYGSYWKVWYDGRTGYTYGPDYHGVGGSYGAKVARDYVYVRKGPSTGYSILGRAYRGQIYRRITSSGSWTKVYFKGTTGWAPTAAVTKVALSGSGAWVSAPSRLALTWYKQQTSYWCGPTTVQIVAKYLTDNTYTQYSIARAIGTGTGGTSTSESLYGLRRFADSGYFKYRNFSPSRIIGNINRFRPVPLPFQCRYLAYTGRRYVRHISPIKGYTSSGYIVCDTAWGDNKYASNAEMYNANRYWGGGEELLIRY